MIFDILNVVYEPLRYAFACAENVFNSIGLSWVSVVTALALLSAILRVFFRVWVGDGIGGAADYAGTMARDATKVGRYQTGAKSVKRGRFEKDRYRK